MFSRRHPTKRVEVVDLDPYGTAAPFIDSAVNATADGGEQCLRGRFLHPLTCCFRFDVCHLHRSCCACWPQLAGEMVCFVMVCLVLTIQLRQLRWHQCQCRVFARGGRSFTFLLRSRLTLSGPPSRLAVLVHSSRPLRSLHQATCLPFHRLLCPYLHYCPQCSNRGQEGGEVSTLPGSFITLT